MSKAKEIKPSSAITLDGLPETIQLWSKTVPHPDFKADDVEASIGNGSAYADTNKSHKRGDRKNLTLHFTDSNLTAKYDGKLVSLRYQGINYRWKAESLTDEHKALLKEYKAADDLNTLDIMQESLFAMIMKKLKSTSSNIDSDQFNQLISFVQESLDETKDLGNAYLSGAKPEVDEREMRFEVQIG